MKKLVSLALAAVLAVSAVGCGSSSDSSSSTADSAQSTEAAADGATFKIGGIGPMPLAARDQSKEPYLESILTRSVRKIVS